jgi:hypothetical protein
MFGCGVAGRETMMRLKSLCIVVLVCHAAAFPGAVNAQTGGPIKVKFEVDNKESSRPFKVLLSVEGSAIFEPPISGGSFVFPPELRNAEEVRLRFISGEYDLDYGDVHISKFDGEMVFGVDNAPFDKNRLGSSRDPNKELILIYYLETGNVSQTVHVYK